MQEAIESESVTRTRYGGSGGQGLIKDRRNAVACYRIDPWPPSERGMVFHDRRSFLFFEASSELPFCMGQTRGKEPRKGKGRSTIRTITSWWKGASDLRWSPERQRGDKV